MAEITNTTVKSPATPSPEGEVEGLVDNLILAARYRQWCRSHGSVGIIQKADAEETAARTALLSRISPSPVGNTSGRDPDGSGLSQVEPASGLNPSDFDPSREVEHPVWAIWRWIATNYKERDPTTGEPYERVVRPLVSALSEFEWVEGPFPLSIPAPAIEARRAETQSGSVEDESAVGEAEAPLPTPSLQTQGAINPPDRREEGSRGGEETFETIAQWCEETFGPIDPVRIVSRAAEEMEELRAEPWKVEEAADVVIVLSRYPDLWPTIVRKMKINRARKWRLMGDGTGYHIKDASPRASQKEQGDA